MKTTIKWCFKWLLKLLYQVKVEGLDNYLKAGDRVLIVANHMSYLDAIFLGLFLPGRVTFAIDTQMSKVKWFKPFFLLTNLFPMDPANPLAIKSLIKYLKQDNKAVIFPEGRITVTGALMKIYQGSGMVADKSNASILPVRIEGSQYTPFSHLRGRVPIKWFPRITLRILPAKKFNIGPDVYGSARRKLAGKMLSEIMTDMVFSSTDYDKTLFEALLDAKKIHGGRKIISEDINRVPHSYNQIILKALAISNHLTRITAERETVGLLLPNSLACLVSFIALQYKSRVPALLNFSVGLNGVESACRAAKIKTVITSKRFVNTAGLTSMIEGIGSGHQIVYLEDVIQSLNFLSKLKIWMESHCLRLGYARARRTLSSTDVAVILFTSGSEGSPKGVALSHKNFLANQAQLASKIDFSPSDVILNVLPMFHSFGLSAGTLLPICSGIKVFFYPSPLHYRVIPEIAYEINATILFGTNTFLAGYAKHAHPYDFYSLRYVFAGAEKLKKEILTTWIEKFGIRILEGYGATEASPGLSFNTPMEYKQGSVGRLFPGIEHKILKVSGIDVGGRLFVKGPNIMLGYITVNAPGEIKGPVSEFGDGWYDTGDIVDIDEQGFIFIKGRAKRFAKVAGEMISLTAVEEFVSEISPGCSHAALTLPDERKGEQILLVTSDKQLSRKMLLDYARDKGIGELSVPRSVRWVEEVPVFGTGKIDYPQLGKMLK